MKHILGSLIISFGILLVTAILLRSLSVPFTGSTMKYLGIAWAILAIVTYPLAKKIMRD